MRLDARLQPTCAKVGGTEAWRVFRGSGYRVRRSVGRIFEDEDHSGEELREIIIGHSKVQRLLVVSFAEGPDSIRIFSARKATRQARQDYEENVTS